MLNELQSVTAKEKSRWIASTFLHALIPKIAILPYPVGVFKYLKNIQVAIFIDIKVIQSTTSYRPYKQEQKLNLQENTKDSKCSRARNININTRNS